MGSSCVRFTYGSRLPQAGKETIRTNSRTIAPGARNRMTHDREITFGRLLRELRLRAGFSQEQLAERAGMSTTGVGVLERELRHAPHRATVELLADALALSPVEREAL